MHEQWPGHAAGVMDRPVFWAELGLVSAPALLARMGGLLQECAARDEELSQAMHLAARHVKQECLVWAPYISGIPAVPKGMPFTKCQDSKGLPDVTIEMSLLGNVHGQPEPIHTVRSCSEIEDLRSADSISSDCSGDEQPRQEATVMSKIFARHPWVKFLPGVGQDFYQVPWLAAMAAGACFTLWLAFLPVSRTRIELGWLTLCADLALMQYLTLALSVFNCIPMMYVVCRLARSKAWEMALRAELNSSSGQEFLQFLPKAVALAAVLFVMRLPHCLLARGEQWIMIIDLVTVLTSNFVHSVWYTVFFLLCRLSSNGVRRLRDQALFAARSGRGWATLVKEYQDFGQLLYGVWTQTGVSFVTCIVVVVKLGCLCWTMVLQMTRPGYKNMAWHLYLSLCDASVICLALHLMAGVSSEINSNRPSRGSLLSAALQSSDARLRPQDALDRLHAVKCIEITKCGIEVPFLGTVTTARVAPLVRLVAAAVPTAFGLALRLAHQQPK